jgi:hypothetical protein
MTLFDTLALTTPEARVVDVMHQSFRKFFKVMQDIDFIAEARERKVEPAIFYIADRNPDSYAEALNLRDRFRDCPFVAVDNPFLGAPAEHIRNSGTYRDFLAHDLRLTIPVLDPASALALADPQFSLSDFMRQPVALGEATLQPEAAPLEGRAALRPWLMKLFRDIHRISRTVTTRQETAPAAEPKGQDVKPEKVPEKEGEPVKERAEQSG